MQISIFTVLAAAASFAVALPTKETSAPCGQLGNFHKATVKPGQTLTDIAKRWDSGICNIVRQNGLADADTIYPGQQLLVPVGLCNPDNTSCLKPVGTATCVKGGQPTHVVASGETFFKIAQGLGITTDSLTGANPGVVPESLQPGQTINVPVCK